jgi:cytochrome P450
MPWLDPRAPASPVDITADAFTEDPIAGYDRIRRAGPIVWQPQGRSFLLTRYADTFAALRDARFAPTDSSESWRYLEVNIGRDYSDAVDLLSYMPFTLSGERHAWMRRSFAMGVAPFAGGTPAIARRVAGLLDKARRDGGFDLAADFAGRLLFEVMCDLLEIEPSDRDLLEPFARMSWALEAVLSVRDRDAAAAEIRAARAMLMPHVARLVEAGPRGFAGAIFQSLPEELADKAGATASIAAVMLIMGNDAIGSCIAMAVRQLKENQPGVRQEDWTELSDDAIRFTAPVDHLTRRALEDLSLCGCAIGEGQRIILSPLCANHDPAEFGEEAGTISIKPGKNVGLTFGAGSHLCVGNRFSRTLVRLAMSELAALPEFRIAGPAKQRRGKIVRTLQSLPVEFI